MHRFSAETIYLRLGLLKPFSRALRFCFGELLYSGLRWYLGQLQWPDVPDSDTQGITWLEFVMDFELSTGLLLPAAARRRTDAKGERWRRGASDGASFAIGAPPVRDYVHQLKKSLGLLAGSSFCLPAQRRLGRKKPFHAFFMCWQTRVHQ